GQVAITGAPVGDAVELTNRFSVRAFVDQSWERYAVDHAMYLSGPVARGATMRAYFVGDSGWFAGVFPTGTFDLGAHSKGHCNTTAGCSVDPLKYVVLVWSVGGADVGVAIHRSDGAPFVGQISQDSESDNLSWHSLVYDAPLTERVGEPPLDFVMKYD